MRHPEVDEAARGTFGGLSTPAVVSYLRDLGVSAVELMPIHAFVHDRHLIERGLKNYWGYNSIGFFAPHPEYVGRGGLGEVKTFVQVMHDAGIEVILDVVYNHTAEGNQLGPTLSFRGIDNRSYYYLMEGEERYYNDFTGCGNALELHAPPCPAHGDRFAPLLGRGGPRRRLPLRSGDHARPGRRRIYRECELSRRRGAGSGALPGQADRRALGHRHGRLPGRRLSAGLVGMERQVPRYGAQVLEGRRGPARRPGLRVSGSADLYDQRGRRTWASVNFVTAHDGFTLRDLVSYNGKHNEANKEDNRDGTDDNNSWNCGAEGTDRRAGDPELRRQQMRNFLATLLLSQGVPMLLAGDEFGTHPGRQQQRLLPGQRDQLDRLGHRRGRPGSPRVHPAADRLAPRPYRAPPQPLLPGPARSPGPTSRT